MKKIVTYLAVAMSLALAVALVPTAEAGCGFLQNIQTYNGTGSYGYVRFGPDQSDPTNTGTNAHAGTYWELGLRADNADACGPDQWTRFGTFDDNFDDWYIYANTSAGCVTNCINTEAVVVLMDTTNSGAGVNIMVALVPEETTRPIQFDLTPGPGGGSNGTTWPVDLNAAPMPRPRVTASSRTADTVNLDLAFDSVAGFFYDGGRGTDPSAVITGYTLHTRTLTKPAADPGRAASAWGAAVETVPLTAAIRTAFPVNCSDPDSEVWVAAGLMIDGYETEYLSAPTRVECNATLADPTFKLIDRPGPKKGPKRER
jgi:hypothetical protein